MFWMVDSWKCTAIQALVVLLVDILITEGKVCVKREEIGNREGNLYNCDDPILTECCERNRTFTCCEPHWKQSLRDQLWILLAMVVVAILMCFLVSWCSGQSEFFHSPTARDAAKNWRDKFVHKFDSIRGLSNTAKGTSTISASPYTSLGSSNQSHDKKPEMA